MLSLIMPMEVGPLFMYKNSLSVNTIYLRNRMFCRLDTKPGLLYILTGAGVLGTPDASSNLLLMFLMLKSSFQLFGMKKVEKQISKSIWSLLAPKRLPKYTARDSK